MSSKKKKAKAKSVGQSITEFPRSREFEIALDPCADPCGIGEGTYEWPNNVLSSRLVVYESGRIAREGEEVRHDVDPAELERCKRLAEDLANLAEGLELVSETEVPWVSYFQVANLGQKPRR